MSVSDGERLAGLEEALHRLRRAAAGNLVVVEGLKDAAALDILGVGGRHEIINRGLSLVDLADELVARLPLGGQIILLTDWDRTGGRLHRRLADCLVGRVKTDATHRRRLALWAHAKAVEDLPVELAALRRSQGTKG